MDVTTEVTSTTRGRFATSSEYDGVTKFKCPFNLGFWHYSPNGCCLFINPQTKTINHLYLLETCSLTRKIELVHKLVRRMVDNDEEGEGICDNTMLNVTIEPFFNNVSLFSAFDLRIFQNMSIDAQNKLLVFNNQNDSQSWHVLCDTGIEYISDRKVTDAAVQNIVIKNIFTPLTYLVDLPTFQGFFSSVTFDFIHRMMPIINDISDQQLFTAFRDNINFIAKLPAQRMIQHHSSNNLLYMDGRDLFDIVKLGQYGDITNLRLLHIVNEANFIDTWRRVLFNFVHELVNLHSFDKNAIRVRSSCNALHFVKGNNKTVIPEFRCDSDSKNKCVHLMARRKEYEMFHSREDPMDSLNRCLNTPASEKGAKTITLDDKGTICRHVLETMVEEYGEEAVDKELNFICFFDNSIFEQSNFNLWERVTRETLNIDKKLYLRDSSSVSRERIACMQELCNQKRMNDIHRFCLPKRFLTLMWFKWACTELKLNIFDDDD